MIRFTITSFLAILLLGRAYSATAYFSTAQSIPITAASYSATGSDVNIILGFQPRPGTELTVIKNTGIAFIVGKFGNLAQGQQVNLAYGGQVYRFVANYFGGTGNDLVLQWAQRDLLAWGSNNFGALGNGNTNGTTGLVQVVQNGVLAGKTVVSVVARGAQAMQSLALCADGSVAAWGLNRDGQLGNGSTISSSVPVMVIATGVLSGKTVVAISAGDYATLGRAFSLALCSDGKVAAWGGNSYGQLGNGGTTSSNVPVLVTSSGALSGKSVVAVSAGDLHSLVLCSDGTVASWGTNSSGQLGNGGRISSNVPVLVTSSGVLSGKSVVFMSAGDWHNILISTFENNLTTSETCP